MSIETLETLRFMHIIIVKSVTLLHEWSIQYLAYDLSLVKFYTYVPRFITNTQNTTTIWLSLPSNFYLVSFTPKKLVQTAFNT